MLPRVDTKFHFWDPRADTKRSLNKMKLSFVPLATLSDFTCVHGGNRKGLCDLVDETLSLFSLLGVILGNNYFVKRTTRL